jgi:hypothetical protein
MSRRSLVLATVVLVVCAVVGIVIARQAVPRESSLYRGPDGWSGARHYLLERGVEVATRNQPLGRDLADDDTSPMTAAGPTPGVLVMTFPWQRGAEADPTAAIDHHLRSGGDLILAYSGELDDGAQRLPMTLDWKPARAVSLRPWAWAHQSSIEWSLTPAEKTWKPVQVWAPRLVPQPPDGAEILFKTPSGLPAISVFRRLRGRVVLLPAGALSNQELGKEGNSDLLESLIALCGDRWSFEEYQHGYGLEVPAPDGVRIGRRVDLLVLHLLLLYGLAVLMLARRQGPSWVEPTAAVGSAATFLRGVGTLHERLHHDRAAALQLIEHSRELDRELQVPAEVERWARSAGVAGDDRERFLSLARTLSRMRRAPGKRVR